jgi:hypothetical protein
MHLKYERRYRICHMLESNLDVWCVEHPRFAIPACIALRKSWLGVDVPHTFNIYSVSFKPFTEHARPRVRARRAPELYRRCGLR